MNPKLATARVRLSDSAILAGSVSLLYALALTVWPRAFPELLARIFEDGFFFRTLALALVVTNEILYVFIYQRRAQKPKPMTFGYIALFTIALVSVLRVLLVLANQQVLIAQPRLQAAAPKGIGSEELLVYTHLGIVSGIFFPFLLVRLTEDYVSAGSPEQTNAKARSTAAG